MSHAISAVREELEYRHDGPVTAFVLIYRACELAAAQRFSVEDVANGLSESLNAFGYASDRARESDGVTGAAINSSD